MDNKNFIRLSHISVSVCLMPIYIIIIISLISIGIDNNGISFGMAIYFIISTFIIFLLIKYFNSIGLYIDGINIYYKNIMKHNIHVNEIAGIKIIRACGVLPIGAVSFQLKTINGTPLYSAILLKEIDDEMYSHNKDDLWFCTRFRRKIICRVIYDKDAVDYLKSMNPNIIILGKPMDV